MTAISGKISTILYDKSDDFCDDLNNVNQKLPREAYLSDIYQIQSYITLTTHKTIAIGE